MPIPLGVLAVAGAGAGGAAGAYELLETVLVGSGGQATITFSNLNSSYGSTYQHLQIRAAARTARAANGDTGNLYLNGVTTSSYARHYLQGNGSAVSSDAVTSQSDMNNLYALPGANATANAFAAIVIDILDPFEGTKNTTVRALSGLASNENLIRLGSGFFNSTAAVTSITLDAIGDFAQYSRFSLYGMRSS
jgi:hypothetical protein